MEVFLYIAFRCLDDKPYFTFWLFFCFKTVKDLKSLTCGKCISKILFQWLDVANSIPYCVSLKVTIYSIETFFFFLQQIHCLICCQRNGQMCSLYHVFACRLWGHHCCRGNSAHLSGHWRKTAREPDQVFPGSTVNLHGV